MALSVGGFRTTKPESDDVVVALRDEIKLLNELLTVADDAERSLNATVSLQLDEILGLTADLENAREDLERRDATVRALRQRLIDAVQDEGKIYIGYVGPHLPNTLT